MVERERKKSMLSLPVTAQRALLRERQTLAAAHTNAQNVFRRAPWRETERVQGASDRKRKSDASFFPSGDRKMKRER
jgi:hypothetical protein